MGDGMENKIKDGNKGNQNGNENIGIHGFQMDW
jgi:hypothetical protein